MAASVSPGAGRIQRQWPRHPCTVAWATVSDDFYLDLLFFHRRMQRLVGIELE